MATKNQLVNCKPDSILVTIAVVTLVIIAVSSVAHTTLALKENSQGKSNVVRQQCINGLENAAVEAGVCSLEDLQKFEDILLYRETQGIKAAKEACQTYITEKGCRGLCIAAINCYDLGI